MRSRPRRIPACLTLLLLLFHSTPASAQLSVTGRWTSKYASGATWNNQPVHMILTRGGDGGHHSQILWYDSNHAVGPGFLGGVWGWTPGTGADSDCTQYPTSRFEALSLFNPPPHNIFCTGHSALADGRILVTGGTEGGETGVNTSALFSPWNRSWQTTTNPMSERRWYPTTTTLPDGRALVASGSGFLDMQIFGGRLAPETGTLANDSLQLFGLSVAGQWLPPRRNPGTAGVSWPEARDAHSASWIPGFSQWMIFGGRTQAQISNETWWIQRDSKSDGADVFHVNKINAMSPPIARYRHSSIG